jgi:hypothetical protein
MKDFFVEDILEKFEDYTQPVNQGPSSMDQEPRNMYVAGGVIKAAKKFLTKTPEPKPTTVKPSILKREAVPLNLTQISEISKNKEFEQAWKNYKISIRKVGRRKYSKDQFFEMWARENMAQGGRIGFYKGNRVKLGPNKGKWAVSYKIKGKSATEYFPDEEAANKFISEQPGSGGARKGSGQKFKAGKKITFTTAEVKKINDSLPNGITLQNLNGYFNWNVGKSAGPSVPKLQRTVAVTNKDIFKDLGLNEIKNDYNNYIEEYLPNRITQQKYQQLRYLDDNINLTLQEFADKLNSEGYTSMSAGEPLNLNTVSKYDKKAGVVKNKQYSIAESEKLIANSLDPSELEAIKRLNLTTKERETFIRKKANSIRSNDRKLAELGSFANTNSREAKLFNNFYSSYSKNTRMQIGGNFEGNDLSNRENWPKHSDGRINWNAKGKNGEPAWKSAVFTDTQVPDKANPGKFKKVKLSFNDLESQVDNAFGEGYFKNSTQAYVDQKQAYKTEGGKEITRKNIIETYKKKYNGAIPEEGYIQKRMSNYSPSQVHHFAEGGVGANPYDVQLTSRSANQALENVEKGHRVSIKNAAGDPNKITEADNIFKNQVNKISKEMGGIKTIIGGEIVGGEATVKSAYNFEKNLQPKQIQLIKDNFCGNKKGGQPGTCDISEALDNMVRETNAVKNGQIKGAAANNVLKKAGKIGRFGTGTGLGAVLGPWGIAGEAAFEIAMAVPGYGKGKSGKRLLGDSLLGLIPGVGQSSEEEFTEYATKDGMQDFEQQQIKDANRFLELNNSLGQLQNAGALEGKGVGRGNVGRAENLFFKQMDEYTPLYNQFVGAPPSESVSTVISEQDRINRQIAEAEAIRAQKRNIAGEEDFMAAEGGLANLMKKYYD